MLLAGGSGTETTGGSTSFTPSASPSGPTDFLRVFADMTSVVASGHAISVSTRVVPSTEPALNTPSILSSTPMSVARRRRNAPSSKVSIAASTSKRTVSFGRTISDSGGGSSGPVRASGSAAPSISLPAAPATVGWTGSTGFSLRRPSGYLRCTCEAKMSARMLNAQIMIRALKTGFTSRSRKVAVYGAVAFATGGGGENDGGTAGAQIAA